MRVPSTEVQINFGKYLKIAMEEEPVIITKNDRDVARIDSCTAAVRLSETSPAYASDHKKVTYEDYLELTASSDDRYELIDGVLYLLESPVYDHQAALGEIYGIFYNWFKMKACRPLFAPFDVTLFKGEDNINVVQPDIVVICDLDRIDGKGKYKGVPTLVIEAVSPSTRRKDMMRKLDLYLQTGVKEYWLVDPEKKSIYLYEFENGDIRDHRAYIGEATLISGCFPGLEIHLAAIFSF